MVVDIPYLGASSLHMGVFHLLGLGVAGIHVLVAHNLVYEVEAFLCFCVVVSILCLVVSRRLADSSHTQQDLPQDGTQTLVVVDIPCWVHVKFYV